MFVCPAGDALEFMSLKLPGFAQGSGQPMTATWLCFMLKYVCQAPIAANARVMRSAFLSFVIFAVHSHLKAWLIFLFWGCQLIQFDRVGLPLY